MADFLRLRHQLLPYLATMNVRAHEDGQPIVQPMYYDHPDEPEAYTCPNQFMFGSELLVAPITAPADASTGLGRVKAWLPEGDWVDVFTGLSYRGERTVYLHRDLTSIPVLAKAGAILPMVPGDRLGDGTDLPSEVEVRVYPGADGELTLVEDRDDERWARTRLTYDGAAGELTVHDVEGTAATLPGDRSYRVVVVRPAGDPDGEPDGDPDGDPDNDTDGDPDNDTDRRVFELLDRTQMGFALKASALDVIRAAGDSPGAAVVALQALDLDPMLLGALTEILLAR
jgi:hypothetical protein